MADERNQEALTDDQPDHPPARCSRCGRIMSATEAEAGFDEVCYECDPNQELEDEDWLE